MSKGAQRQLDSLVKLLVQYRAFCVRQGQPGLFGGFEHLGWIATEGEGTPEERVQAIWRSSRGLGHRDGPYDRYAGGDPQSATNRQVAAYQQRIRDLLASFAPPDPS